MITLCNKKALRYYITLDIEITKIASQGTDYKSVFFLIFLSFWTNDVTNFPKISGLMSPAICRFRFSIFGLETLKFTK